MKHAKAVYRVVAALMLLGGGLTGWAQGQGPGSGPGFGPHRPPLERALGPGGTHGQWWNDPNLVQKLKLSDDQRKSMDQILQQHREMLIDMRASVEKAEIGMDPLIKADQPNEAQILAQIDKVAQARAELEKANARFLLALRAKLTPDQWKQLQAERSERRSEWRRDDRHRGPMMPHAHGPEGGPGPGPDDQPGGQPGPPPGPQGAGLE